MDCRSQSYDGAPNVSGHTNGCAAIIKHDSQKAEYYYGMNHDLNLALSYACKCLEMKCML